MTAPGGVPDSHRPGREAAGATRSDHAGDDRDRLPDAEEVRSEVHRGLESDAEEG
jgi:hypothetical protein